MTQLMLENKQLMSGNQAIARGAWEAGVQFATGYPGTPSTEILENITSYAEIEADWSTNEKVALDVAMGVSLAGKRVLVTMKHVGVNVAADSLMVYPYSGCIGGMVIVTADDPGMHSSQNEQDNRYFAKFAKVPILEPTDPQEAKDFVRIAFELSEEFETPVLLRTTTRISHAKGVVELGDRTEAPSKRYRMDIPRFLVPPYARRRRPEVEKRLARLQQFSESFEFNRVEAGDSEIGVIASGVGYQYAREVLPDATYLRLGMAFPFPIEMAREFCERFETVHVIEEGEPFVEEQLRIHGVTNLVGKEKIPLMGELSPEIVAEALGGPAAPASYGEEIAIPPRPPLLCLGCPHRAVFYVLQQLMPRKVVAMGDIGCYTLGGLPPYSSMQTCFCLGASVGNALGFALAMKDAASSEAMHGVGVIGDGTFLHGGIPGLIDMVHRQVPSTLVICDNSTTAMTGQQENPASARCLDGSAAPELNLPKLVEALGVGFVRTVDPYDLKALRKTLREAIAHPGPAVVIAEHACLMLEEERNKHREPVRLDMDACNQCGVCHRLGCPAIDWDDAVGPVLDEIQCVGCDLCVQLCAPGALMSPEASE